ncbi:hypothetical protein TVAG_493530 [Trichomonas vaginalis G3]|uniref:F5/8 type C domain-containing protein n=1 Tax=Trichomonas vaginalis (strain ATCC PRA-98 / G3) TaxID=412133 RepID=A2FFB9_TRIV3|nr:galactose-binding domain-like family [Trichomonas vaginalis G3]EAX96411.1 hypothetical protein TVAG_493530 [Trichomonas vaginalis G3]KAI5514542.1 galactose-binding domain-like family [Trichomonas vaginalis G3]|eukprot:XP_001309341.1 hypothetical protein [Trichomonas vaginalis G3]
MLFIPLVSCSPKGTFYYVFDDKIVNVEASGSSKQYHNGSSQYMKPEYSIYPWDKHYDWCSNCEETYDIHPWITFSLQTKKLKFDSYFIRAGCCREDCCCENEIHGYCVECCLYSWSLQISNDNETWAEIHKVVKDEELRRCNEKTYKLDRMYEAKFVRLIQNEACPEDPPCIAINKFEFIGERFDDQMDPLEKRFIGKEEDNEDISIIGQISRNGIVKIN